MKCKTIIAGADNGVSASWVFLDFDTEKIYHIEPYNPKTMYEVFKKYKPKYVVLEEVFMSPGFKSVAHVGFEVLGRTKQVLEMLEIPYDTARAKTWRAYLNIKAKGREQCKEAAIKRCSEVFDDEDYHKLWSEWRHIDKETHKRVSEMIPDNNKCESALIALYALRKYKETYK